MALRPGGAFVPWNFDSSTLSVLALSVLVASWLVAVVSLVAFLDGYVGFGRAAWNAAALSRRRHVVITLGGAIVAFVAPALVDGFLSGAVQAWSAAVLFAVILVLLGAAVRYLGWLRRMLSASAQSGARRTRGETT